MAGYSQTPLIKKLGIKPNDRILIIGYQHQYSQLVETDLTNQIITPGEKPDLVHLFLTSTAQLDQEMSQIKKLMKPSTTVWISWYKKSSGIKTDLNEDIIREYALNNGLVDVKVCAVDENWSALKLVVPLKLR